MNTQQLVEAVTLVGLVLCILVGLFFTTSRKWPLWKRLATPVVFFLFLTGVILFCGPPGRRPEVQLPVSIGLIAIGLGAGYFLSHHGAAPPAKPPSRKRTAGYCILFAIFLAGLVLMIGFGNVSVAYPLIIGALVGALFVRQVD